MRTTSRQTQDNSRRTPPSRRSLSTLFLVALGARLAFLAILYSAPQYFDANAVTDGWDTVARNLIDHQTLAWGDGSTGPTITRTPVYPAFLAILMLVSGGRLLLVRLLYLALDAAVAVMVAKLSYRAVCSRPGALAAGAVYAMCPLPAWHMAKLSPDAFFGFLLVASLLLFLRNIYGGDDDAPPWRAVVVSGIVLGVAVLTRKTILLLVPVWLLAALVRHRFSRRAIDIAIVYALAASVVVAPWLYRNYQLAGRTAPIQTLAWTVYWYGNFIDANVDRLGDRTFNRDARNYIADLAGDGLRLPAYALTVEQDLAREDTLRRLAIQQFRDDPSYCLAKSGRNLVRFWYLTETGRLTRYTRIAGATFFLLFLSGAFLLARRRQLGGAALVLLLTVLYFNAVYAPFHSILRYLIPVTPIISVFAGVALSFRSSEHSRGLT